MLATLGDGKTMTAFSMFSILGTGDELQLWCVECWSPAEPIVPGAEVITIPGIVIETFAPEAPIDDVLHSITAHWAQKHHHSLEES